MARPIKAPAALRTRTMRVRISPEEEAQILLNVKMARYRTASDFLRSLALGTKPKSLAPTTDEELLIRLKGEVGKLGSNVNQIARALNRHQEHGEQTTVPDHLIINAMYGVDTLTKHILELLGYGH